MTADSIAQKLLKTFGAQLGEIGFHYVNIDDRLQRVSSEHGDEIIKVAQEYFPDKRQLRILEIGAFAHSSAYKAGSVLGARVAVHDISANSLRIGAKLARESGYDVDASAVAGDFHDLPFSDNYFDIVFCSACIHHTWRPWIVLGELMRVTRPGGIVRLDTEPVIRTACFYQFRSHRIEEYFDMQLAMNEAGMTRTLTSPYPGSRPEALFGIIENDRIPISVYKRALGPEIKLSLLWRDMIGPFEQWLLDLPVNEELAATISAKMHSALEAIAKSMTERDRLLGFTLPTSDRIWLLSYQIADGLRELSESGGSDEAHAKLFGATLKATAVKQGSGKREDHMFRRSLIADRGVLSDMPELPGVTIDVHQSAIAPIERNSKSLERVFQSIDWQVIEEENGLLSVTNLMDGGAVFLPKTADGGMLVLRTYSVATDEPYLFQILAAKTILYSHVVCVSESHLARVFVPPGQPLSIKLKKLDGSPHCRPMAMRIVVAAYFPVSITSDRVASVG